MTTDYDRTPSPDAPQAPMSRGRVFIMISELAERQRGLLNGTIQPQSAQRTARQEVADLQVEIDALYKIGRMK